MGQPGDVLAELPVQLTDLVGEGPMAVTWAWQMVTCTTEPAWAAAWASDPGPGRAAARRGPSRLGSPP